MAACNPTVQRLTGLQCEAAQGSKTAQLELGKAYEAGAGVPQDLRRAAQLYKAAASRTSGTTYVYSPPVGKAPAQVLPIRSGPDAPGLAEAMYRLGLLYRDGRGVRRDIDRGQHLIAEAVAKGLQIPRE